MTTRTQLNRLNKTQQQSVQLAIREMRTLWASIGNLSPEWQHDLLLDRIPQIAERYGDIAATAAAEWYEQTRPDGTPYEAIPYGSFNPDAIRGSVDAKAYPLLEEYGPTQAARFLEGAMQRWVRYAGRQTIARNCTLDPLKPRWARVPSGAKTCAFCEMLASRGYVYTSQQTAGALSQWHDHCDCSIVPQWDQNATTIEGYDPDLYYGRYLEAWHAAGGEGSTIEQVTHWMRQLHPDAYTDA